MGTQQITVAAYRIGRSVHGKSRPAAQRRPAFTRDNVGTKAVSLPPALPNLGRIGGFPRLRQAQAHPR
jgi:hypothetical protein